jgi:hypothetical protein
MSSAEPPAGRRPDDGSDAAQGDERPMSREDLFGPRGPFGVGRAPAPPPGASGFEPPEDETRAMSGPEREDVTRAFRAEREPHPRDDADLEEDLDADLDADDLGDADRTQVYQAPPPEDRTQVYRPTPPAPAPSPPAADPTQVYTPGQYQPGQYQPRSMQQGGYDPGGYQPGQYSGYGSQETIGYPGDSGGYDGGPSGGGRTWLVAALVAVLVVVAGAAAAWVLFGGNGDDPDTAAGTGATTAPTASASQPEETEPEETESAEPTESESAEPPDEVLFEPIPAEPWTEDLDFGYLTKVTGSGDDIELTFNRATFYYGEEAAEKNGGEAPDNDYLIEDTNKRVRTFELKEGAALSGSSLLGGDEAGPEGRELTREELVENAKNAGSQGIPVWLRHEKGRDSAVTALAEQFIP